MRISRITWIILGAVVFVLVFGVLYMQYSRQADQQQQLRAELAANQAQFAKLSVQRQDLEKQLATVQAELSQKQQDLTTAQAAATKASQGWPSQALSTDYDEELFKLANGWTVPIKVVSAGQASALNIQGIPFQTTAFSVAITSEPVTQAFTTRDDYVNYIYGQVGNILGFIDSLANDKMFATAKINVVNMTIPALLSDDALTTAGTKITIPSATVSVTVYTQGS